MIRFALIFCFVFLLSIGLIASIFAQYNAGMFERQMLPALGISLLVALYVAWRINTIMVRRAERAEEGGKLSGAQKGKLSALFTPSKSQSQLNREARVAARRKQLIKEGKLEEEVVPETPPEATPKLKASAADIKDKMAARAERVRRAKEQGKL